MKTEKQLTLYRKNWLDEKKGYLTETRIQEPILD